jgi:hypothetical protein
MFDVNFGAPPPSDPDFRAPIRPQPPSSHPCSALTAPCMCPAGTTNGVGNGANGAVGTAHTLGIAAIAAAAAAALSRRAAASFSSILRPSQFRLRLLYIWRRSDCSRWVPWRLPGGAEWPGPGQAVGWGRARGRGGGSDARRGPWRASARAFCAHRAISRNCNSCPRSDLGCPVEYRTDLGCFG